jgi:hypothetical protein
LRDAREHSSSNAERGEQNESELTHVISFLPRPQSC